MIVSSSRLSLPPSSSSSSSLQVVWTAASSGRTSRLDSYLDAADLPTAAQTQIETDLEISISNSTLSFNILFLPIFICYKNYKRGKEELNWSDVKISRLKNATPEILDISRRHISSVYAEDGFR